ncbi:uncharacterized protein EV154DRAFT_398291, partial [Mucor mucedo]|uniref:uncharacterized protein n=1 Tax=Mucor mucedo TaxID=29922 RepID=UPI002220016F
NQREYYKDLPKAVSSSNIHFNKLVEDLLGMTQEKVKNLRMSLCAVTGATCYVNCLYLESCNL